MFPSQQLLITITGPSGAGKDAVIKGLMEKDAHIKQFPTATTRPPRPGEQHGVDYYFLPMEDFNAGLEKGDFLEHNAAYHGNKYGTLKHVVADMMADGFHCVSDINYTGVAQFKEKIPQNLLAIALMPPSVEALEKRFKHRAQTSKEDNAAQQKRMEKIRDDMLHKNNPAYIFKNPDMIGSCLNDYHHVVVNDVLDDAVTEILSHIHAAQASTS